MLACRKRLSIPLVAQSSSERTLCCAPGGVLTRLPPLPQSDRFRFRARSSSMSAELPAFALCCISQARVLGPSAVTNTILTCVLRQFTREKRRRPARHLGQHAARPGILTSPDPSRLAASAFLSLDLTLGRAMVRFRHHEAYIRTYLMVCTTSLQ